MGGVIGGIVTSAVIVVNSVLIRTIQTILFRKTSWYKFLEPNIGLLIGIIIGSVVVGMCWGAIL
jgi:hypothetical protein